METIRFLDNADELHEITITEQHIDGAAPYRIDFDGAFYATARHYTMAHAEAGDILRMHRAKLIGCPSAE